MKKNNLSGCLSFIVAGAIAVALLYAFGGIGTAIERIGEAIPWWIYIILIAVFIYFYHSKNKSD